jgi:hypothetical protein
MPVTITNGLDNVGSAVGRVIQPYLVDVAFTSSALFSYLDSHNKLMECDPNFDLTWAVMVDKANGGMYSGLGRFANSEKQLFRPATVTWKQAYSEVVVTRIDALRARGPASSFTLSEALKQAAKMKIVDIMGEQIFSDGTGVNMDGSAVAIDDGTFYPTYATIPRASVDGWQSFVDVTGGSFNFAAMTHGQTRARRGNDSPDLAITTPTIWETAANRISTQQIFDKNSGNNEIAELGYRVISNLGCNLVDDAKCPAGQMNGYNTEYMQFCIMQDGAWNWTGWDRIPGTDGYAAQFLLIGNFEFLAPWAFFSLYNLT